MRLFERRKTCLERGKRETEDGVKEEAFADLVQSLESSTHEDVELRLYVGSAEGRRLARLLLPLVEEMGFALVLKRNSKVKDRHLVVIYKNHLKFKTIQFY
jgi:hypothetical protein